MKKLLILASLIVAAAATAATTLSHRKVSDAEVNRAIDERLHEMLVKLNAEKK